MREIHKLFFSVQILRDGGRRRYRGYTSEGWCIEALGHRVLVGNCPWRMGGGARRGRDERVCNGSRPSNLVLADRHDGILIRRPPRVAPPRLAAQCLHILEVVHLVRICDGKEGQSREGEIPGGGREEGIQEGGK